MFSKLMMILVVASFMGCSSSAKKSESKAEKTETVKEVKSEVKKKSVKAKTESSMMSTCTLNDDERTIEVKAMGDGCEVVYTKHGASNSIASAMNGTDHCGSVQDKVKSNLENAGFSCK